MYRSKVGHTADVQQLGQIHTLERAGTRADKRALIVDIHTTVFLHSFQPGGMPFVQRHGFGRLDDRRARADVETEFGYSVSEAERKVVAGPAEPLTVVYYQTLKDE